MRRRAKTDRTGQIVMGRYRVVRPLAQGGMGLVYLARIEGAQGFVRPAVIKQMLPDLVADDELVRLFVREARILSELRHPGVVSVLDFSVDHDAYLMALEYVHGYHAGHWLKFLRRRGRRFDPALASYVVCRVLDALDYVHARADENGRSLGIVHRDVSPSNVLIDVEGRVRLVDFGVARVAEDISTTEGHGVTIKGKLAYVAPELLRGEPPSIASDLFACGVVLHELLSGRNELRAATPSETFERVLQHDLSALERERGDLPAGTDELLRRATARDPLERFETAGAMAAALRELCPAGDRALESRLAAAARRDFVHELPGDLRLPALDELERAWREPVSSDVRAPADAHPSEAITLADRGVSGRPSPPAAPGLSRWLLAALVLLAAAGAALGALALFEDRAAPGSVVVVDRRSLEPRPIELAPPAPADDAGEPPTERAREPAESPQDAPADALPEPRPPAPVTDRSREDRAARLTHTVHRQRAAIEACFVASSVVDSERREISVRFRIARDGTVRAAELSPASLGDTPLGACLLRVARQTRFDPQPQSVSFRIPITVSGR